MLKIAFVCHRIFIFPIRTYGRGIDTFDMFCVFFLLSCYRLFAFLFLFLHRDDNCAAFPINQIRERLFVLGKSMYKTTSLEIKLKKYEG